MSKQSRNFHEAAKAVDYATTLYRQQVEKIETGFRQYVEADHPPAERVRGHYPKIEVKATNTRPPPTTKAFGFLSHEGSAVYEATFTAPNEMTDYFTSQLDMILKAHGDAIEIKVGLSDVPIPLAYTQGYAKLPQDKKITAEKEEDIGYYFDRPDPREIPVPAVKDKNADNQRFPLTWYSAPRIDKSLQRISYYTGTDPRFFQDFILFTNYPTYMDLFAEHAGKLFDEAAQGKNADAAVAFVSPGNQVEFNPNMLRADVGFTGYKTTKLPREPQMPAYHIVRPDGRGVSIVNIGVGPSNAANITDHLAVLRPEAWMMVGHCAGLESTQRLGHFVVPNGYVLEDGLMEKKIAPGYDVTDVAEIQKALMDSIKDVSGSAPESYKSMARTGVVVTTANRNWEDPETEAERTALRDRFARSNAIGLDMESGTIAANGFWHRVPHGAILCVSDRPLHGEIKMSGGALDGFYRQRVKDHFQIAMAAVEKLRQLPEEILHTRKLRSTGAFVPFQ